MNTSLISCDQFQMQLDESVERCADLPEPLLQHADHCSNPACMKVWEEYVFLDQAINDWKLNSSKIDIADRVLHQHLQTSRSSTAGAFEQPNTSRNGRNLSAGKMAAVCAALMVAVFVISTRHQPDVSDNPVSVASHADSLPDQTAASEELMTDELLANDPALADLGAVYVQWVQGATTRVTDTVAFVLLEPETDSTPASSQPSWIKTWGQKQLEPIEQQLDRTLRIFLNEPEQSQFSHDFAGHQTLT